MKVFAVYKGEMLLPYWVETLVQLFKHERDAEKACKELNDNNKDPMEKDCYGPMSGSRYEVVTLYVK